MIQVGASGYETYEERITLDENIIRDITLTALPVEQGAVSLTVVDSETKAKIAAYVYDKDTGGILGQVTKIRRYNSPEMSIRVEFEVCFVGLYRG